MYVASNGDLAAVARALGHARASALAVTLDTYIRTREQRVEGALRGLGDALARGAEGAARER